MATITVNKEKNGIEITFPEKPGMEVLAWLKQNKYRWSQFNKIWYKKFSEEALKEANDHFKE